jgi:hypothetical protein
MRFGSLLFLVACSSQRTDFENFCHAHERAGVTANDAPGEKALKISRYLAENLKTAEAKEVLAALPRLDPSQKRAALSDAAKKHGVAPCPLADVTWPSDAGP